MEKQRIRNLLKVLAGTVLWISLGSLAWADVSPSENIKTWVASAEKKAKKGEWEAAKDRYGKALKEIDWCVGKRAQILKAYEDLNLKILFSRRKMPESIFYNVQSGDSVFELAKKHHTTVELIRRCNGLRGDIVKKGQKIKIVTGRFSIQVIKRKNELILNLNGKAFKHYRVATGKDNKTPVGKFKIVNRVADPAWYKKAGVVIPAGTDNNHLGTRWLGFDIPKYGIHGTVDPDSIGTHASQGCIRMLNTDVEELYDIVPLGTLVTIQN